MTTLRAWQGVRGWAAVGVMALALAAGCPRKGEEPIKPSAQASAKEEQAAPATVTGNPRPSPPGRSVPRIVSISPETVTLNNGRLPGGVLTVYYEIQNPEGVEKATAVLYSPGFLAREMRAARAAAEGGDWPDGLTPPPPVDVPVQPSGSVDLSLDAPDFDLTSAPPYLEVKLRLKGPGLAVVDIKRLPITK
jgi:hypothetical protein